MLLALPQAPEPIKKGVSMCDNGSTLVKDGVKYQPGDYVYVHPLTFDQVEGASATENSVPEYAAKGRFHKVTEQHFWSLPSVLGLNLR